MKGTIESIAFNRGILSRLGTARVDIKRTALSAAVMSNWMPRVLGSMMLRPGLGYLGATRFNSKTRLIPFVFSSSDAAVIECTSTNMRVWANDALVSRPAVTAVITNGEFVGSLAGWTDADEAGATSTWDAGGSLSLSGSGTNSAIRYQLVTVVESGVEHGLRVVVGRGTVMLRVGSTVGGAEYLSDVSLRAGEHSIAFTPAGNFYVQLANITPNAALVDRVSFDAEGPISITTPWFEQNLPDLRWTQSGDVIFVACKDVAPARIERRADNSWSCVNYDAQDGPFLLDNVSPTTITASSITGAVTLTASKKIFKSGNVDGLYKLRSVGQSVTANLASDNSFTNSIRVVGTGEGRRFGIVIAGTFTANVILQYSSDNATWLDRSTFTAPTSTTVLDGLENQIIYYRLGIKTGGYTSGAAGATLNYSAGSITGTVRVTGFVDETQVIGEVLIDLGSTTATQDWAEGAWSTRRGFPTSVALHDGRLFWAGNDRFWGSVTDQFETFDADFIGDAGPISRSIGEGPVDNVTWLMSLNRMVAGTGGALIECRSSSLDEPLTPTNFTPKVAATRGCSSVAAVKVDNSAIFVQRSGFRVFEMNNNTAAGTGVLSEINDLTMMAPEVCEPGIVVMAAQREPDTRLHCVLADGTVAVLVWDSAENVICWSKLETAGSIEDVAIIPGTDEDAVYYVVRRTVNGTERRYFERLALERECRGGAVNKLADSFVYAAGSGSSITGLDHLEGQQVVVWAGGQDLGTFTVAGGSVVLPANGEGGIEALGSEGGEDIGSEDGEAIGTESDGSAAYANRMAGLPYDATFKSTKLASAMQGRSGLTLKKKVHYLGLVLADTHPNGLRYGPDFNRMDPLPQMDRYAQVPANDAWDELDTAGIKFPGEWDTDSRICLKASAPRACTALAVVADMDTNTR
jgi:hypothetical protein